MTIFGRVNVFNGMKKILADKAQPTEQVRTDLTREVDITLGPEEFHEEMIRMIDSVAQCHPGQCPLQFRLAHPEGGHVALRSQTPRTITPDQTFVQEILSLGIKRPMRFLR